MSPRKTKEVPIHCLLLIGLLKIKTEPRTVKNFLVVVITEHLSGPNVVIVVKMKCLIQKMIQSKVKFKSKNDKTICYLSNATQNAQ
jgi:hypothetical protein